MSFQGSIQELPVPDIIQLVSVSGKTAMFMAGATTLALMVLRVDYYYVLGPIAGIAVLLPYVGIITSTVPAVAVAYFQYGGEKALLVFLVYSLLQFLEGNVLTPYIVGGKVKLFPLTVMT